MSTVNEKMTALANEVRELSGTTTPKSIDAMTSDVNDANAEVSSQTDLIAQIKNTVDNLPEASKPQELTLQNKTVTPTASVQTVTADGDYDGLDTVTVNAIPSNYIVPNGTKSITTNGTHDIKQYASVSVNVTNSSEDVTTETNAYTTKLTILETAVAALETELAGKASGGGESFETCVIEITYYIQGPDIPNAKIVYMSVEQNQIITKSIELSNGSTTSITCLCNSIIGIMSSFPPSSPYLQEILNGSNVSLVVYRITADKNTSFSIFLGYDPGSSN